MEGKLYEITTHRREGGYTDFRRPDFVDFSAALSGTSPPRLYVQCPRLLPETGITDLFGGLSDIQNKIIRCVGDPLSASRRTRLESSAPFALPRSLL